MMGSGLILINASPISAEKPGFISQPTMRAALHLGESLRIHKFNRRTPTHTKSAARQPERRQKTRRQTLH
jgi:hypothetical protein